MSACGASRYVRSPRWQIAARWTCSARRSATTTPRTLQLAARYLGLRGERIVVPALEVVARGESRGNRETGPRVEAIEALGRIGAPEALPTLQALANKRSLLGAGRYREIRAAASAAMAAIRMTAGGGGPT